MLGFSSHGVFQISEVPFWGPHNQDYQGLHFASLFMAIFFVGENVGLDSVPPRRADGYAQILQFFCRERFSTT